MSKLTFLSDNLIDNCSLSLATGTANAQFPLANIKKTYTTKVFRSIENTVSIIIDLQSTFPVDSIAMVGDNTLGFNTATLKGSGSLDFSGSTVHTLDLSHQYNFGFKQFTSESHRYWLLTLTGSSYCEVSNIFLGSKTELPNNDIETTSFEWGDDPNVSIQENKYGQLFINEYNVQQILDGSIKLVNPTEYAILDTIFKRHGKTKPLWFILDPNGIGPIADSEFIFSGYFNFKSNFKWKTITTGYYSISMSLKEVI